MIKLTNYKHSKLSLRPNKKKLAINLFTFDRLEEFNQIYQYCRKHFTLVKATKSQGISYQTSERFMERYLVNKGNERFELCIVCASGCYRFVIRNKIKIVNTISGTCACREIYKQGRKHNIDFNVYGCENGKEIKEEIVRPHIEVLESFFLGKVLPSVHHIDLNSSYASRIVEAYPELKDMYEELYAKRKMKDEYFKHVLTNSIGCFQSEYCIDPSSQFKTKPYYLSKLAKAAVNGTRAKIEELIEKLKKAKKVPLLSNTDGIWYYGNMYHDENEGEGLGQWKHDHSHCKFLMMGPGAYQYLENAVCKSVVRGISNLDVIEPDRDKWAFGCIKNLKDVVTYHFDEEKGIVKNVEKAEEVL